MGDTITLNLNVRRLKMPTILRRRLTPRLADCYCAELYQRQRARAHQPRRRVAFMSQLDDVQVQAEKIRAAWCLTRVPARW